MENLSDRDQSINKYQVTILFYMDGEFMHLVPKHRLYINSLIEQGIIDNYAVSMETQRTWMIINAVDKKEVEAYLIKSPLFDYWTVEIDSLYVYDSQAYRLPALQLN